MAVAENGSTLVHETRLRLRFRLPALGNKQLDFSYLQTLLESVVGVNTVRVNAKANSAIFEYDGRTLSRTAIIDRMGSLNADKLPHGEAEAEEIAELAPMLTTAVMLSLFPFLTPSQRKVVTLINISKTLLTGLDTFINKGIKMEVLDAIAVGLTASRGEYFTANTTDFLMDLGTYLERKTERQSDQLLRRLLRPEETLAWVENDAGELIQMQSSEVKAGNTVVVGVGERIPVDGLVLDGTALVNQASLTGEAVPVRKEVMDRVISGTVVDDGRIKIEARHVGEETTTARISQFIDDSLSKRSQTQQIADKLADQRVYLTLGTGFFIYLLTGDARRLESVFLVDYSCALKLGTPVAFKSGMYNAASAGVLLKGGQSIEQLAGVDTFVFDKTGTLTHADLEVTDVEVFDEEQWPRERLLAVTASIEEHATHPIAEAIVRSAKESKLNHIDHGEVGYLVAHGMTCPVNGDQLTIGSRHFLEEHENISFDRCMATINRLESEGKTLLYVGIKNEPLGVIALQDTVRPEAARALQNLRSAGVKRLIMLTGDRQKKADALGGLLGIDEVYADLAPEDKAGIIERFKSEGSKIAFVGDGVNDGPALVTADVGIAMPRGAEIARATADVVLLEDELDSLVDALQISQQTMDLIKSNFKLAVGINTGVLVGATMGWLSPIATAVLHNGTTIGLLVRALRGANADENTQLRH